ncbi:MAG: aldolase/citrate lyase family protein [Pseudomonadota bacterium]
MNGLNKKIMNRELTVGSWITLAHPAIAEIMVQAGFDWLTVDMEHSATTISQAQEMIRAIELSGVSPFVRVGENNANLIKRVMDAGAHGVIVPMVNTKADAEAAVAAVKYPPVGKRGVGLARAQKYGFGFEEYKKWVAENSIVIVQIEHISAIENLEAILSTPGVDGSIIGPYDLSGSLGWPGEFERPEVKEALKRYETICDALKKPKGFHIVQPDPEKTKVYIGKGYSFLAVGLDTLYLGCKCRETLDSIKNGHNLR